MATRYVAINALSSAATTILTDRATGTALKTLVQLVTASTTPATIVEVGIGFDGTSASAVPIEVRLQRQTSAGTTGTGGGAGQINKVSYPSSTPANLTTSTIGPAGAWTTEPTASDILASWKVPATSGMVIQYPLGREPTMDVSTRLGLVTVSAASVNAWWYITYEE